MLLVRYQKGVTQRTGERGLFPEVPHKVLQRVTSFLNVHSLGQARGVVTHIQEVALNGAQASLSLSTLPSFHS